MDVIVVINMGCGGHASSRQVRARRGKNLSSFQCRERRVRSWGQVGSMMKRYYFTHFLYYYCNYFVYFIYMDFIYLLTDRMHCTAPSN